MYRIVTPEINNYITKEDKRKAKKINKVGGELYIVGGFVRDIMLNKTPNDKDFCVVGLTHEKFKDIFPEAEIVGKSFGVYMIDDNEFAFARKERNTGERHKDFKIDYSPNITIEEDLKRRDITINAMAIDILKEEIILKEGTINDLSEGIIKGLVNEKGYSNFTDDPLRVFRVARFASQLDFNVDNKTVNMMRKQKDTLSSLPKERVFKEFRKALLSNNPQNFFKVLYYADCMQPYFKEIKDLWYVTQPKEYHPEYFTHKHMLQSLEILDDYSNKGYFRFAVLMHDIGKGITPDNELPHHYRHCSEGIDTLAIFTKRLGIPNKWYKAAIISIKEHQRIKEWKVMSPGKVVRLFKKIDRSPLSIEEMVDIVEIDLRSRGKEEPLDNVDSNMEGIVELYNRMFEETGGEDIDSDRYSGKEFGEQLFQYRCHWLKRERNKLIKEEG